MDGADVVALLLDVLLLTGAEEAAPLLDCVVVAEDGAEEAVDDAVDVAVLELEVSDLCGADDGAALVVVDDVALDVEEDCDVDAGALLDSFLVCESVSVFLALSSDVVDASVVTTEDVVPVVDDEGAPLASSSEPK